MGIMEEIQIWPLEQKVYTQPNIGPGEWYAKTPLRFWLTNRSLNLGQTTRPYNDQQIKRTCKTVDFDVSADHRVKLKKTWKKG